MDLYLCSSCFIVALIWLVLSSNRPIISFFSFIASSETCVTKKVKDKVGLHSAYTELNT